MTNWSFRHAGFPFVYHRPTDHDRRGTPWLIAVGSKVRPFGWRSGRLTLIEFTEAAHKCQKKSVMAWEGLGFRHILPTIQIVTRIYTQFPFPLMWRWEISICVSRLLTVLQLMQFSDRVFQLLTTLLLKQCPLTSRLSLILNARAAPRRICSVCACFLLFVVWKLSNKDLWRKTKQETVLNLTRQRKWALLRRCDDSIAKQAHHVVTEGNYT